MVTLSHCYIVTWLLDKQNSRVFHGWMEPYLPLSKDKKFWSYFLFLLCGLWHPKCFSTFIAMKKYLLLRDIGAYTISFHLSNYLWNIVCSWHPLAKFTIGEQFVEAVDSISANIAEGFGRYNKKDKIRFYRYSSGSITESLDWNEKAYRRKLLSKEQYEHVLRELKKLPREVNYLIQFTNKKLTM